MSHWLARTRSDPITFLSPPLVVWYGWATSDFASRFAAPILTINNAGWTWIAQVDKKLCAWNRLSFIGDKQRLKKPPMLEGFDNVGRERGADVTWRTVAAHAGEGFFRVGDAGAVLDPGSSHGVFRALITGITAARCSTRILRLGHLAQTEANTYHRWVDNMVTKDVNALKRLYRNRMTIRR
jgi:flavin-dependent dehydrogenase